MIFGTTHEVRQKRNALRKRIKALKSIPHTVFVLLPTRLYDGRWVCCQDAICMHRIYNRGSDSVHYFDTEGDLREYMTMYNRYVRECDALTQEELDQYFENTINFSHFNQKYTENLRALNKEFK